MGNDGKKLERMHTVSWLTIEKLIFIFVSILTAAIFQKVIQAYSGQDR